MANIKYFTKGKSNPTTIYLRFTHGRSYDFKKSSKLLIDPKYWNNKKGTVKQIAEFNDKKNLQSKLNNLNNYILNSFNDEYSKGSVIDAEWLNNSITACFNQNNDTDFNYFIDYADYLYKTLPNKVQRNGKTGVTKNTLKRYTTIINKFKEFEKYSKKRLTFDALNLKFYKDFKYFLINDQKLNLNTTGRYINYIKSICTDAKKYGIKTHPDIEKDEFRATKEKVGFITLSKNEILKIFKHDFNKTPYLDNARNWLIIGLWTGARVSDLLNLNKDNIKNGFIEYTSIKTGQKIILPLHEQVKEIINKNNGQFPRLISNQKFNDYIKIVCQSVGINEMVKGAKLKKLKKGVWRKTKGTFEKWELVSTHICRRSFATNHYGKLPTPVIMAVTGHKTEKMFLNYIGKTSKDNAEELKKYWKLQEQKHKEQPQLKIVKTVS